MKIEQGTFAEACYNDLSIKSLQAALESGPDATDCESWGITAEQWVASVEQALAAKLEDEKESA